MQLFMNNWRLTTAMRVNSKCKFQKRNAQFFSYYLHTIFTLILQLSASLIHIHGKSFPIQFDSFCPSPDTRHETKKTLNSVIYRKKEESERKMMVAMRLGFIEIELSQQNFVPPIGNNFFASESQCVHGAKKFILFFVPFIFS